MAKWKKAIKVNAADILRNCGIVKEGFAVDQSDDTPEPSYAFVAG